MGKCHSCHVFANLQKRIFKSESSTELRSDPDDRLGAQRRVGGRKSRWKSPFQIPLEKVHFHFHLLERSEMGTTRLGHFAARRRLHLWPGHLREALCAAPVSWKKATKPDFVSFQSNGTLNSRKEVTIFQICKTQVQSRERLRLHRARPPANRRRVFLFLFFLVWGPTGDPAGAFFVFVFFGEIECVLHTKSARAGARCDVGHVTTSRGVTTNQVSSVEFPFEFALKIQFKFTPKRRVQFPARVQRRPGATPREFRFHFFSRVL